MVSAEEFGVKRVALTPLSLQPDATTSTLWLFAAPPKNRRNVPQLGRIQTGKAAGISKLTDSSATVIHPRAEPSPGPVVMSVTPSHGQVCH